MFFPRFQQVFCICHALVCVHQRFLRILDIIIECLVVFHESIRVFMNFQVHSQRILWIVGSPLFCLGFVSVFRSAPIVFRANSLFCLKSANMLASSHPKHDIRTSVLTLVDAFSDSVVFNCRKCPWGVRGCFRAATTCGATCNFRPLHVEFAGLLGPTRFRARLALSFHLSICLYILLGFLQRFLLHKTPRTKSQTIVVTSVAGADPVHKDKRETPI